MKRLQTSNTRAGNE